MTVKHIINGVRDLTELKEKWLRLEKGADMTVFQSYEWNILAYEQYRNSTYNKIFTKLVVYETDNILVPAIIQKHGFGFRWLGHNRGVYLLGEGTYSDYLNFIYSDVKDNEIIDIINYIYKDNNGLQISVSRIREEMLMVRLFSEYGKNYDSKSVSVEVDLPASVEEYDKILSKSTRQNIRTSLNRINRDSMDYTLLIYNGVIDKEIADELVPIHLRRVLEINSGSESIKKRVSNWIKRKQLIHNETKNNIIYSAMTKCSRSVLILCKLNGNIAGYLYGLSDFNTIRILQNCFVDEYKFYSPMFRGSYDFITNAINKKQFECIDFTRGDEEYKYRLGGSEINLYSYRINEEL